MGGGRSGRRGCRDPSCARRICHGGDPPTTGEKGSRRQHGCYYRWRCWWRRRYRCRHILLEEEEGGCFCLVGMSVRGDCASPLPRLLPRTLGLGACEARGMGLVHPHLPYLL